MKFNLIFILVFAFYGCNKINYNFYSIANDEKIKSLIEARINDKAERKNYEEFVNSAIENLYKTSSFNVNDTILLEVYNNSEAPIVNANYFYLISDDYYQNYFCCPNDSLIFLRKVEPFYKPSFIKNLKAKRFDVILDGIKNYKFPITSFKIFDYTEYLLIKKSGNEIEVDVFFVEFPYAFDKE